ncbi:MAG: hypothetical protein SH808_05375 [Saprospiraceae bacterium]|nr:hypothetical protein [Saprospiraceae bacterium]
MKKSIISLFSLSLFIAITPPDISAQSLVGKWKGEDNGEVGVINFDKEGYVSFTVGGELVGGKNYQAEGITFDMYYETNDSVTPQTVDFIIRMDEGQIEVARMQGIYAMVDKKTLVINMKFDGTERPAVMDDTSEDQITLKKMKK